MNLFEKASKLKLRFITCRGVVPTEALWDLPLTGDFSLNELATDLKKVLEDNANELDQLRFDIVNHILDEHMQLVESERMRLVWMLHERFNTELQHLTNEELEARIAALQDLDV